MRDRSDRGNRSILAAGLVVLMTGLASWPVWAGGRHPTTPRPAASDLGGAPAEGVVPGVFREAEFAADPALAAEAHHLVVLDLEPGSRRRGLLENRARYRLDAGTYTFCLDEDEIHLVRLILEDGAGKRVLRLDRPGRGHGRPPGGHQHGRRHGRRPCDSVSLRSGVYQLRVLHDSGRIDGAGRVAFLQPGSFQPGLLDDTGAPLGGLWALRPDPSPDPRRRPGRVVASPPDRAVPPFTAARPVVVDVTSQAIDDAGLFGLGDPRNPSVGSASGLPLNLAKLDASGLWTLFADDGPTRTQTFFQTTAPLVVTELDPYKVSLGVERPDGRLANVFLHETTFSPSTLMLNYDQAGADPAPPARFDVVFRFFPDGSQVGDLQEGEVAIFQECQYQGKAAVFAADTPALAALSSPVVTLDKTAASVRLGNNTGVYLNTGLSYTGTRQLVTVDTPCLAETPIGNGSTSSLLVTPLAPSILLSSKKCENCQLVGVDLSGVDLSGVDLQGANLTGANFTGTSLRNVTLRGAILDQATGLAGSDQSQVVLSNVSLRGVDFSSAKLYGAQLNQADLEGADLRGAFLTNNPPGITTAASLVGAHLKNANLSKANLSGADLTNASLYSRKAVGQDTCAWTSAPDDPNACATAAGATMNNTQFGGAYLFGVDFTDTTVQGVQFSGAVLIGANFAGATVSVDPTVGTNTGFENAFLQGANLGPATLTTTSLLNAFLDFSPGGNSMFLHLNEVHATFPNWHAPGKPICVLVAYGKPTTVPTANTTLTCPDGTPAGAKGCGSMDVSNTRWASSLDISTFDPPASYLADATYTKAGSPVCTDLDLNW